MITIIGDKANIKRAESYDPVVIENQLVPEKDENGYWTFTTDRDLKIMQLTDIHLGGGWLSLKKDSQAINAVATMIQAEKPDLVIITGDMAFPVFFKAATFNNKLPAKEIAAPVIAQSPLALECRVKQIIPLGSHDMFLAEIVAVDVEERLLDETGKLHLEKAGLMAYSHGEYFAMGKKIGSFGYSVRKKRPKNPTGKRKK